MQEAEYPDIHTFRTPWFRHARSTVANAKQAMLMSGFEAGIREETGCAPR